MNQRTALYRHFDSEGRLLYVGISLSAVQRLAQHRDRSAWFDQITRVAIEWLPSRSAALEAEARAIHDECPMKNKAKPPRPVERHSWAIEHLESGSRDGNYFIESMAREVLAYFVEQHPADNFRLVSAPRDVARGATAGRPELRDYDLRARCAD